MDRSRTWGSAGQEWGKDRVGFWQLAWPPALPNPHCSDSFNSSLPCYVSLNSPSGRFHISQVQNTDKAEKLKHATPSRSLDIAA